MFILRLKRLLFYDLCFNPQAFSDTVLIVFFVGPKSRKYGTSKAGNQKPRRDAYGKRALFRPDCCRENKVFGKPQSTAIKSERISNLYPLPGAFHGYTDEKEEDLSYYSDGIHSVEHHAF